MDIPFGSKLLRYRRTKIVATVGPSSQSPEVLEALIAAGVNVFRLNMSHGTHENHRVSYERIRRLSRTLGRETAILADLCGPKIRVGKFSGGSIVLTTGSTVVVTTRDVVGGPGLIPTQYTQLAKDVVEDDRIMLDDGNLELHVDGVDGDDIRCTVVAGGVLKDKKGMNLPGVAVSATALTEKDRDDARFALDLGIDLIALSFVRRAADVEQLRTLIRNSGRSVPIISKIEKPEALTNIDGIIDASDGIMIARGDLGVELPPELVPNVQEHLVDLARARQKPVIVATQMLESMMTSPRPTRAEVTDVANAVRSGADAVMLSGETAAGAHPTEAVRMMDMIVRQTEGHLFSQDAFSTFDHYTPTQKSSRNPPFGVDLAVANSAALLSRELLARGIIAMTKTGRSLEVMSSARPAAPLVGVSSSPEVTSFGCLLWGVLPVLVERWAEEEPTELAKRLAKEFALLGEGPGTLLVVSGFRSNPQYTAPTITVIPV